MIGFHFNTVAAFWLFVINIAGSPALLDPISALISFPVTFLADSNINLILDNNILDIKDSSLFVNNSPVLIDGRIDEKSVADIKIRADKVPLPVLFNAFAPKEVRNAYNFKSADASLELGLNGKLKNAIATAKVGLENLNIGDKAGNFILQDKKFVGEFFCNSKT